MYMSTILYIGIRRLRRTCSWSNSLQSWKERCAALVLIAGLALAGWFGSRLSTGGFVAVWALLLAAWALLARAGWIHLFGPLLAYDLTRTIRRSRLVLLRIAYALFLFVLLLCLYLLVFYDSRDDFRAIFTGVSVAPSSLANFASAFSYGFSVLQLLAVVLLVPAYTAGAVAEESERGTLEAMLVTDLRNREIVLGMVVSRLGSLMLIVLGGLPILAGLQFLGGIDPNIILAASACSGMTMVGLAGVSILCSVYARRTRQAIVNTYLVLLVYLALSGLSELLLVPALGLADFPSTGDWISPITLADVVDAWNAGNFVTVAFEVSAGLARGGHIEVLVANAMRGYAWFHGLVAAGCVTWAVLRLRVLVLRESTAPVRKTSSGAALDALGLGIGKRPMIWKSLVVEARSRRGLLGLVWSGLLIAGLMWPGIRIIHFFGRFSAAGPEDCLSNLLNLWVRGTSMVVGCFLLLGVAVRASAGISGERERQTLDGLLATTLSNRSILFGKWLGCIFHGRWSWFWLGLMWSAGIVMGAVHPLAIPCFLLAWLVYAAFLAGLGLWFSVASRNSRRALIGTLTSCLVGSTFFLLAAFDLAEGWLTTSEAYSLLPPQTLGLLAFSPAEYDDWTAKGLHVRVFLYPLAVGLCAGAAAALWFLVELRFRHMTGRELVPEAEPASAKDSKGSATGQDPADGRASLERVWTGVRLLFALLPGRDLPRLLGRAALLLLPLVVLLGWYFWSVAKTQSSLEEALAETDRADPGWRLEDLDVNRPVLPDEQNSALRILKIKDLLIRPPELAELDRKAGETPANVQLDSELVALLKKELEPCRAAMEEVRILAELPNGRFPGRIHETDFYAGAPWAMFRNKAGTLANLLGIDILVRAQDDVSGALDSCRAIVNIGHAGGSDPLACAQGIRTYIVATTIPGIERILAQGEPKEDVLASLQKLLAAELAQPLFVARLRGRRAINEYHLRKIALGAEIYDYEWRREPKYLVHLPTAQSLTPLLSGSIADDRIANLRIFDQLIVAAKLPPMQRHARFSQLDRNNPNLYWSQVRWMRALWELNQHDRWEAELHCAVAALAVERYRRKHGSWPQALSDLVPALIPEVPSDPMDGKPIRYRRTKEGVVIYSIGIDRVDNGGNIDRVNYWGSPGKDLGIRLWDPAKRRQPPGTTTSSQESGTKQR
jgi:ABC-type transport system involved in multi-copper enzyme maturation permease subunit